MNRILIFIFLISNTAIAQVDLTLGLKAYYPFNGNANDASGNNNNPSFNNATLTSDRFGNTNSAYQFNGVDNYMRIPNNPSINFSNKISLCAWVKVSGYYYGACHTNSLIMKGDLDYLPGNYLMRFDEALFNPNGCSVPLTDTIHHNFRGPTVSSAPYFPYINKNQWYSVVYTYDGITAKLYVDCQLKYSTSSPQTFTNNYDLYFGHMNNATFPYWFNGTMDEIRIYDRPLTSDEVKVYGDCSLLSASTDIGGIINTYTPVLAFNSCENKITTGDVSTFNTGDTVLMIQMKGAAIDSTNTAAFGTIADYKNAGNYEFNYVKSKTGNIIELKNKLSRQYDIPNGKVQLVRVPYYQNANITSTLTCLPWDGSKGGILVLNVQDSIILNANIDVTGKGFREGNDPISDQPSYDCYQNQYFYPSNPDLASEKGEGIALISSGKSFGKGPLANGGGSGNSHNSGGAGGGNSGNGGHGGYNFEGIPCNTTVPFDNGGIEGKALSYSNTTNKIFLGGGGGAGHSNAGVFQGNGGNGAGIIMIIGDKLQTNNKKVIATGSDGAPCGNPGPNCHEGMGGGGAGGTVLSQINNYLDNTVIEVKGGKGADMTAAGSQKVGPGGGGGGGILWLSNFSMPGNISLSNNGGQNGVCTAYSNDPWGSTPGQGGNSLLNLQIPVDNILFKRNIDSVRIKDSLTSCSSFDFKGFGYSNTDPVSTWQWYFGDGGTANTQNASHTYISGGTYTIKLIITDINGCKDSTTKDITINCLNSIGNIINTYTPVLALDVCLNKVTVADGSTFNIGDTVLIIQMKGAVIDSTNTAAFGTITDYKNAGNYEFNYVNNKTGNVIELKNKLTRQYDIPVGKVQLIRIPYYNSSVTITSTLSCLPWDGNKGGVLAFNVRDTIFLNAGIDVTGKGFAGGQAVNTRLNSSNCFANNYFYPNGSILAAPKGESIYNIGSGISSGKGPVASGGGGGVDHNSGGGGGANGGSGGFGGYQWINCGNTPPFDNRGIGGKPLTYSNAINKIFLGGGGGAGHCNQPNGINMNGGNGGGIVIIKAEKLISGTNSITAKGAGAVECTSTNIAICNDGGGGGGAGGSILLTINNYIDVAKVEIIGGKGADLNGYDVTAATVGPGGGGGGGIVWTNQAALPANININNAGGINGVIPANANNPWGTTAGQAGINLFDLSTPIDNVLFKKNIDSVRIKDSAIAHCSSFDFKGFGYINTDPVSTWQWWFGDGGTATTQNTSHTYSLSGTYPVKLIVTDINGCKDSIIKNVSVSVFDFDFSYKTNACSPLDVQFNATGTSNQNPFWVFGDAATISGTLNPIHTYAAEGIYTVKYSLTNAVCTDTIIKTIDLAIVKEDIILTHDTTICAGSTKQLLTIPSLSFCWTPVTYLNNPNLSNPTTTTPQNITYYYTAEVTGANVIANGDFTGGNTGFTSQYTYAATNTTEGEYFVGPSSQAWNSSMSNCHDHTSGNGNMMLLNGSPVNNLNVWKQTVTVTPNTNYAFSTLIQALWPPNPAQLRFSINNKDVGTLITASLPTCTWTQFYTTWNSGNNTTAAISIVNKNTLVQGNDFALDDISFAPVFIKRDSVKITVETPVVTATNSTTICEGKQIQLNATGAAAYRWTPGTSLNDSTIANPLATPPANTRYIVTGTTANGCIAKDTVDIAVNPKPTITKSNNDTICLNSSAQLFANGGAGVIYSWLPAGSLNNAAAPNPVATPLSTTTYYVTVTGVNTCTNTDSIEIFVRPANVFAVNSPVAICKNNTTQLNASGGDLYNWTPAGSLSNAAVSNPTASPQSTTPYSVFITDTVCGNTTTLFTTITVLPLPIVKANKLNDIDCSFPQSQLNATGAVFYTWSPTTMLSNPNSASPVATPPVSTQYVVKGTDLSDCVNYDSLTVNVSGDNKSNYLMPTAFTPNNDGKNDCYGLKYWGTILELEFSIYNRWGQRLFYTTNPSACWDGRYKGILQDPNVFVYMVKAKTICEGSVFRKGTFALIR